MVVMVAGPPTYILNTTIISVKFNKYGRFYNLLKSPIVGNLYEIKNILIYNHLNIKFDFYFFIYYELFNQSSQSV